MLIGFEPIVKSKMLRQTGRQLATVGWQQMPVVNNQN
jgi:hypothetical protein